MSHIFFTLQDIKLVCHSWVDASWRYNTPEAETQDSNIFLVLFIYSNTKKVTLIQRVVL